MLAYFTELQLPALTYILPHLILSSCSLKTDAISGNPVAILDSEMTWKYKSDTVEKHTRGKYSQIHSPSKLLPHPTVWGTWQPKETQQRTNRQSPCRGWGVNTTGQNATQDENTTENKQKEQHANAERGGIALWSLKDKNTVRKNKGAGKILLR